MTKQSVFSILPSFTVLFVVCQRFKASSSSLKNTNGSYLNQSFNCAAAVPPEWEDMQGQLDKRFPLPAGSPEYTDVENKTKIAGLQANIISVSRCSKLVSVAGFTPSSY